MAVDRVSVVEVSHSTNEVEERSVVTYTVEVERQFTDTNEVERIIKQTDIVQPGGTVTNVGAGRSLPDNPYEGQIWILV